MSIPTQNLDDSILTMTVVHKDSTMSIVCKECGASRPLTQDSIVRAIHRLVDLLRKGQ